jgi:hypothetical protein
LKPGQATTVYHKSREEAHSFGSESRVTLKLRDQTYQLKVVSPKRLAPEAEGLVPPDAQLIFTSGSSTQTLYSLNAAGESAIWYLLWAGDIDGDGKIDLYLSLGGFNLEERRLFLSSQAPPGQLVKGVAKFTITGC